MKLGMVLRIMRTGGIPKIAINEAKNLVLSGVKAELIIYRWGNNPYKFRVLLNNVPIGSFDKGLLRYIANIVARFTLMLLPIGRELESSVDISTIVLAPLFFKKHYDFLLCFDQLAGISGFIASKRGIPYFTYVHEPLFLAFPLGVMKISKYRTLKRIATHVIYKIEKKVLMNSTAIFFNSKRTRDRMIRYFPFVKEKAKVIYPGCSPAERLPEKKEDFILALSRWDVGKYPAFILDLAERLDACFVIAGSWQQKSLLQSFLDEINKRRLGGRVKLLTNLSESAVHDILSRAKIYIHWIPEGFSMGVLEAMAHGLPVITTREAGVSEIIANGINGFIVEKPSRGRVITFGKDSFVYRMVDVQEYVKIIKMLLNDFNLCKSIGKNAWETSKKYDWEAHSKQLLKSMEQIKRLHNSVVQKHEARVSILK